MAYKYNAFTSNFDLVEDTSGFLTDIEITANTGSATWTSTGELVGTGSLNTVGSGDTVTVSLIGLSNHAVLVGAGTDTITKVGPSNGVGQVLQSNGISADPSFSTATYPSTAGTSGNVMTSDGTNWVSSAPAGGSLSLGYASGFYYLMSISTPTIAATSNGSISNDQIRCVPFCITENATFDRVDFQTANASTAGTSVRVGIYNSANGLPGTVLATLGTILTDSIGVKTMTINQSLTPGYYWMALQAEANISIVGLSNTGARSWQIPMGTSFGTTPTGNLSYTTGSYGTGLPDLTAVSPALSAVAPIIQMRST